MSATRQLALKLGLLEEFEVERTKALHKYNTQVFQYLLVLDFESTCWDRDEPRYAPEIIEFSVVLLNLRNSKIVTEYQQYVMPTEYHKLSQFCTNFTGIQQSQVDNGVPIGTCLMLFKNWLNDQLRKFNLALDEATADAGKRRCTFVTWSDWDLGTCLKNECKRKGLTKYPIFNCWIDLRAVYKEHYNRRPQGLNGALTELGMKFEGRQHSGLHDARNTAYLAGKMVSEGILLNITKDLNKYGH